MLLREPQQRRTPGARPSKPSPLARPPAGPLACGRASKLCQSIGTKRLRTCDSARCNRAMQWGGCRRYVLIGALAAAVIVIFAIMYGELPWWETSS